MKSYLLVLLALFVIPCWAPAEDAGSGSEVTIYSGLSFLDAEFEFPGCPICEFPDSPIPFFGGKRSIDNSFLIGFQYGYYINSNVEVEGNFGIAPTHDIRTESFFECLPGDICPIRDEIARFPFFFDERDAITYHYDVNFVYNLKYGNMSPFFTIGIGGISTDFEQNLQNDFALNFGGGAKFYLKNVGLRFEVNDHIIPSYFLTEDTEHDLQLHYGFLFRL